jgi:hypothetical protein
VELGQNLTTLRTGPHVTLLVAAVICGGNGSGTVLILRKLTGDGIVPDLTYTEKPRSVTQIYVLVINLLYHSDTIDTVYINLTSFVYKPCLFRLKITILSVL